MTVSIAILSTLLVACMLPNEASSFSAAPRFAVTPTKLQSHHRRRRSRTVVLRSADADDVDPSSSSDGDAVDESSPDDEIHQHAKTTTRRSLLRRSLAATTAAATALVTATTAPNSHHGALVANAALGTLPEYADANAALAGLTIDVADRNQYDETIAFFTTAFDGMKVLRRRGASGGIILRETWLGFGPETLSIPPNFELPVSSPALYGGHASLHIRYDPQATSIPYRRSSGEFNDAPAPGDNIAYLQIGVPGYRISQMTSNGGNVLDAYGWVNVVSPAGLPVRGIVGIRADPMMFLAVNCNDVGASEEFYAKLGFVRQEYPYARLNQGQGQFEPPQPSKSVYIAPSANSMGILLLQNAKKKKAVVPNPVVRSLNVVYTPQEGGEAEEASAADLEPQLKDPSSVPISFVSQDYLEKEIKKTSVLESS
mmetsp:Transcript_34027/g.82319  ORF Transcript_34027/g.82319 Transcript_34027/m.82319 type:complete len:428 (+) Transcript_34027:53-1336(+)